jgi:predicted AlkP superfamily phosphohydrolase/phosphomutase
MRLSRRRDPQPNMHPTLLIGLDGATFAVLDRLVERGVMPFLGELYRQGARAELQSTPHPLTPPAWTTVLTGRGPGQHGVFDFLKWSVQGDSAFFTLNNFRDIRCETIFSMVNRAGGRAAALNFPLTAPPPQLEGEVVPGLLSWRHLRRNVWPPELFQEIKQLEGFSAKALSWDFENERKALHDLPDEELEGWVQFHIEREEQWARIARHLLARRAAPLFAVMFDGVDKLQHGCWRLLDPPFRPAEPTEVEHRIEALCHDYFARLDGYLRELAAMAGPLARLFLVSDHGFGPSRRIFRVNKWLESQKLLYWSAEDSDGAARPKRLISGRMVPLDWNRTLAFSPSAASNGICIRVRGQHDPVGIHPEEYAPFREQLIDQLLSIEDPLGQGKLVQRVLVREEVFPGACCQQAPDLTLVLRDHSFVSVLNEEPVAAVRRRVVGTHYPQGIIVARGPGIEEGARPGGQSILDVAATLLYSLGLPIPEDLEGSVMRQLFTADHLRREPPRQGSPTRFADHSQEVAGKSDSTGQDRLVLDQLRALGYLE